MSDDSNVVSNMGPMGLEDGTGFPGGLCDPNWSAVDYWWEVRRNLDAYIAMIEEQGNTFIEGVHAPTIEQLIAADTKNKELYGRRPKRTKEDN